MTTTHQLFNMVRANDYVGLEKAIENKKNLINYCIDLNDSVIAKAIEVRALECFNLLININELNLILQSENPAISGLAIAIDYYLRAPYNSNKYYLEKLVEKSVCVVPEVLGKCICDQTLFQELFPKIKHTYTNLLSLVTKAMSKLNSQAIKWLFDFIRTSNLDWYVEPAGKNKFNDQVLKAGITHDNCEVIDYLKLIGHEIQFCKDGSKTILSLEYAIKKNSTNAFNYFHEQISQLDTFKQVELFPNKKIDEFIATNSKLNGIFCTQLEKLLSLQVPWENIHVAIANLIIEIYKYQWHQFNYKKEIEYITSKQNLIYILGKSGKVNGNPYTLLNQAKSTINTHLKANYLLINKFANSTDILAELKLVLRKNKYLLDFFEWEVPESFAFHWKLIFQDKNYQMEKQEYFNQIQGISTKPTTSTKSKSNKRKLLGSNEITV